MLSRPIQLTRTGIMKVAVEVVVLLLRIHVCRGLDQSGSLVGVTLGNVTSHVLLYSPESFESSSSATILSARPSVNVSGGTDNFGVIKSFSTSLVDSTDSNPIVIGSQVGFMVFGKENHVYISYTYAFNENSIYTGTIAIQGYMNSTLSERAFAVIGGSGNFGGVSGTVEVTAYQDPETPLIYVHDLNLLFRCLPTKQ